MKIYVITKGSYSDYHICAVTTDEKHAEKLAKLYTDEWDDAEVEEYDTDYYEDQLAEFASSRTPYIVGFNKAGEVTFVGRKDFEYFMPGVSETRAWASYNRPFNGLIVRLYAPDEEAAVKIAAEKRVEYLARKLGL